MRRSTTPRVFPPILFQDVSPATTRLSCIWGSHGVSWPGAPFGLPVAAVRPRQPSLTQGSGGTVPRALGPLRPSQGDVEATHGLARPLGLLRPCLARGLGDLGLASAVLAPRSAAGSPGGLGLRGGRAWRGRRTLNLPKRELLACAATVWSVSATGPAVALRDAAAGEQLPSPAAPTAPSGRGCLGAELIIVPQGSVAPLIVSCLASRQRDLLRWRARRRRPCLLRAPLPCKRRFFASAALPPSAPPL